MTPLIENNETITDSKQKANILNQHLSSKATVQGENDVPPNLCKPIVNSELSDINTSPLEVDKIIRDCKKSHQSYCGVPGKFYFLYLLLSRFLCQEYLTICLKLVFFRTLLSYLISPAFGNKRV